MLEPSPDEIFVTLISSAIALFLWGRWYYVALFTGSKLSSSRDRNTIISTPIIALGLLFGFLLLYADREVRGSAFYLTQYTAMGAAIVGLGMMATPLLGICARDDVVERRNPAAGIALTGAILGLMFCYAGSNIGDGPGWWVVVFCTALALSAFFGFWFALEAIGHVSEMVTVERHAPTAVRFHAFLLAIGLILGRAVAGDWVDVPSTLTDFFVIGSPSLVFAVVEAARLRMRESKTHQRGYRDDGGAMADYFLAAGYFSIAVMYLIGLGWWV